MVGFIEMSTNNPHPQKWEMNYFRGMVPIWFLIFLRGVIYNRSNYTPLCKPETSNFRGMVPIWFLIYIKLPLKWALDEHSLIKLTFPCIQVIFKFWAILGANSRAFYVRSGALRHEFSKNFCFKVKFLLIRGYPIRKKFVHMKKNFDPVLPTAIINLFFFFLKLS